MAVLISPELRRQQRLARMHEGGARIHQLLEEGRARGLRDGPWLSPEYAEELVAEIRADRDAEG